ncbi:MAG: ferredoxin:glutaredoxin reductase [Candidatus Bathyarchaeota archaeon]|nr:ferredoxin:glutaredoxin reductase [Candidatus Bathyarchaeota archaeon]
MITVETVQQRAEADAKTYGYDLNPNPDFLRDLLEGLKKNEERYGYPSCPCRLASGNFEVDRDIMCPCDYRDPDVAEFGACYCALYVRKDVFEGKTPLQPVPERRSLEKQARAYGTTTEVSAENKVESVATAAEASEIKMKLWYCKQCGYVVFREEPPYICPICKAKRELFAELRIRIDAIG